MAVNKIFYFPFSDVGRVQIRADPEAHPQGEARHATALRSQATKDAGRSEDQLIWGLFWILK